MKNAISKSRKSQFTAGEIAFVSEEYWGLFKTPSFLDTEIAEIPKGSYVVVVGKPDLIPLQGRGHLWYPITTTLGFGWCIEDALAKISE